MPRVASLFLPELAIERLRPATPAPRPEPRPAPRVAADLPQAGADECSVPRGGGWRPGARWARERVEAEIEALPLHQRPPVRELGRRSEALPAPFRGSAPSPSSSAPPVSPSSPRKRRSTDPERRASMESRLLGKDEGGNSGVTPLVLSTRQGQKLVVAAACPHARAAGLSPGMALSFARALVPGLEVQDADPEGDARLLHRLAVHAARRWSPVVAVDGGDGVRIDMSSAPLFGGEARMARRMMRFLARRGFTARVAIADSAGAAHALARHGPEPLLVCPRGGTAAALAPLPVEALRIAPELAARLHRLGIDCIGELAAMPRGPLARRFGPAMVERLDQACGDAAEPIEPVLVPELPQAALRLAEPVATAEAIAHLIERLVQELAIRLGEAGLGARRVALVCRRIDNHDQAITIGTARATRDPAHLIRLLKPRIETIEPGFGIEALRLTAFATDRLASEPVAGDLAVADPAPDLAPLVDVIAGRIGARALHAMTLAESEVPERSAASAPPLSAARGWPPHWPRPVRLLSPPEPVSHVMAELPDQPPRRFTWRGRQHRVVRADGPERIHGEWWRRAPEEHAVRDYFQVEDEHGQRFWLYRRGDGVDGRTGDLSWWLQGAFG